MSASVIAPPLRRLLRTPAPRLDESLPGYLLKLTEENSYDSLRWIPERAGLTIDPARGQWADLYRPGPHLARFCEMAGLSEAELESLREPLVPDCLVRWKAPKVCPACLREESWCRKAWDVLSFTVCPLHRVVLIDFCPGCRRFLSWSRKSVSVCRCGYDWRRIRSPLLKEDEESFVAARWMLAVWRGKTGEGLSLEEAAAHPLLLEGAAVYPAALSALMDAWLQLRKGVKLQAGTENVLCHQAVASVAGALQDWPESFFQFFDPLDDTALCNWQRAWFSHRGNDLSETRGWLLAAVALEEYLEMRWAGRGGPPVPKRFLRKQEASRYLGRGLSLIDRLMAQGRLGSIAGITKRGIRWIDHRSLRRLRQEIEALMPAAEAAADLGIGLGQFRELVRYGLLSPDSGPEIDGSDEMKFSHQTLTAFLGRIADLVSLPGEVGEYSVISLSQVAHHLEWDGLSLGQFVKAMFGGFPSPMVEHEKPSGSLSGFWFHADEINRYIASQLESDTRPEASLCTVPALRSVVEWLDRRQDGCGDRFSRYTHQPLDAARLGGCFIEILRRLSAERDYAIAEKAPGEAAVSRTEGV